MGTKSSVGYSHWTGMEEPNKISSSKSQLSLSSHSSFSNDEIYQEFCQGNYEGLINLSAPFTLDQKNELASLLIEIAEATYKDRELMDWALSRKLEKANRVDQLFDQENVPESMESVVFNGMKMRFGCVRWLSLLIKPTVEYLKSNKDSGDSDQLKAVEDLLSRFVESTLDIPIWLRQSCLKFKEAAVSKFGNDTPDILLNWFLSPSLLGAIEGEEAKGYEKQIRAINSVVLLIGGTSNEITDQKTKAVVEKKRQELKSFEEQLFDQQSIALAESIIHSSRPQFDSTGIFLLSKSRKFSRILQSYGGETSSVAEEDNGSCVSDKDLEELHRKMDSNSWRYDKTIDHGCTTYSLKSDETKFLAFKTEFKIKGKLVDIAQFYANAAGKPELDPENMTTHLKFLGDGVRLIWGWSEMPWPITDRCFAIKSHEVIEPSKNTITIVVKNCPYPGGMRKNSLLTRVFVCGYRFVQDPNDPEYVKGTLVEHADPKGLFPAWIINRSARKQSAKVPKIISAFLKTQSKN